MTSKVGAGVITLTSIPGSLFDETEAVYKVLDEHEFRLWQGYAVTFVFSPAESVGWGYKPDVPPGYCVVPFHHYTTTRWLGYVYDHINRNRLDNRGCNLRRVPRVINSINKTRKSRIVGLTRPTDRPF
jgi:hypothetical protein